MKTKQVISKRTLLIVFTIFVWLVLVPSTYLQVGLFTPEWKRMARSALEDCENVSGNHTIMKVINFLNNDATDEHEYSVDYDCKHFSYTLIRNATKEGFKCGYVRIAYGRPPGHAMVVFETISSLLFVEPQSDFVYFDLEYVSDEGKITGIEILWE